MKRPGRPHVITQLCTLQNTQTNLERQGASTQGYPTPTSGRNWLCLALFFCPISVLGPETGQIGFVLHKNPWRYRPSRPRNPPIRTDSRPMDCHGSPFRIGKFRLIFVVFVYYNTNMGAVCQAKTAVMSPWGWGVLRSMEMRRHAVLSPQETGVNRPLSSGVNLFGRGCCDGHQSIREACHGCDWLDGTRDRGTA